MESINAHIKSSEMLRRQLKKESVTLRFAIDDLRKRIDEKEEEGRLALSVVLSGAHPRLRSDSDYC